MQPVYGSPNGVFLDAWNLDGLQEDYSLPTQYPGSRVNIQNVTPRYDNVGSPTNAVSTGNNAIKPTSSAPTINSFNLAAIQPALPIESDYAQQDYSITSPYASNAGLQSSSSAMRSLAATSYSSAVDQSSGYIYTGDAMHDALAYRMSQQAPQLSLQSQRYQHNQYKGTDLLSAELDRTDYLGDQMSTYSSLMMQYGNFQQPMANLPLTTATNAASDRIPRQYAIPSAQTALKSETGMQTGHRKPGHKQKFSIQNKHACEEPGCTWSFKRHEHLKRHLLVHSGVRPWSCKWPNCGKTFSRSDNFAAHYRTHTKHQARAN